MPLRHLLIWFVNSLKRAFTPLFYRIPARFLHTEKLLFALPALSKHVKMCYNALIPQEKSAKECI